MLETPGAEPVAQGNSIKQGARDPSVAAQRQAEVAVSSASTAAGSRFKCPAAAGGQRRAIFSRLIMDSPIGFDDNPWIHKAQLSRRPRQQQLSRCTDNKPALFSSFCLHFLLPFKAALLKKTKINKKASSASSERHRDAAAAREIDFGLSHVARANSGKAVWERRPSTLSQDPRMKSYLAPCQNHNLNYIMQRDASGKCLLSVTPEPDKMEQRNHHSEGDFRFTSDCFFPPVTICNSSNRPFSPGLHIKPDFSLLPLLGLAYWQKSHQTNVDLTRRC